MLLVTPTWEESVVAHVDSAVGMEEVWRGKGNVQKGECLKPRGSHFACEGAFHALRSVSTMAAEGAREAALYILSRS